MQHAHWPFRRIFGCLKVSSINAFLDASASKRFDGFFHPRTTEKGPPHRRLTSPRTSSASFWRYFFWTTSPVFSACSNKCCYLTFAVHTRVRHHYNKAHVWVDQAESTHAVFGLRARLIRHRRIHASLHTYLIRPSPIGPAPSMWKSHSGLTHMYNINIRQTHWHHLKPAG